MNTTVSLCVCVCVVIKMMYSLWSCSADAETVAGLQHWSLVLLFKCILGSKVYDVNLKILFQQSAQRWKDGEGRTLQKFFLLCEKMKKRRRERVRERGLMQPDHSESSSGPTFMSLKGWNPNESWGEAKRRSEIRLIFHMRGNKDVKGGQERTFHGDVSWMRLHTQDREGPRDCLPNLLWRARIGEGGGAGVNGKEQRSEVSRDNKELYMWPGWPHDSCLFTSKRSMDQKSFWMQQIFFSSFVLFCCYFSLNSHREQLPTREA